MLRPKTRLRSVAFKTEYRLTGNFQLSVMAKFDGNVYSVACKIRLMTKCTCMHICETSF